MSEIRLVAITESEAHFGIAGVGDRDVKDAWDAGITEEEARIAWQAFPSALNGASDEIKIKGAALNRLGAVAAKLRAAFSREDSPHAR
jgi:hypothetical protein